ncbi:DUF2630 family protein [Desertimonas flava]|jgi:hypothetical protein|uniref:DUF2630 family protein n=1 Tax=Desertimonas flava TaxID=2064846 RepID=UPI000E354822|nr:DUF2630 family protein [Desertimonas flava]
MPASDEDIVRQIGALVDEEHRLNNHPGEPLGDDGAARLRELEVQLDQCWDLLRQRRAKREFGDDPGEAHVRPADVVERYQQ